MSSDTNVCRFCLRLVLGENLELANEITQKILGVLLIKLDLDVSEDPLICKMCSGTLNDIYSYKSKCLNSEDIIRAHFVSNLKVSLMDILIELENKPSIDNAEEQAVCRLCIKIPSNGNYITLNETSEEVINCRNIIQNQLPEIDFSIIEEPIICETCHALLKNYLSFATSCMDVEQKINVYCEHQGCDVKEQVDLQCVLQFTENKALDRDTSFNEDLIIKQEENSIYVKVEKVDEVETDNLSKDDFTDGSSTECYIKEEEIEIKSEDDQIRMETSKSDPLDNSETVGKSGSPKKKRRIKKNESEVKTNFCPKCPYTAKYISSIKRHLRSHAHEKTWECGLCPFIAETQSSLKTHVRSHKGPADMFGCTECPYETNVYQRLVQHVLKHKDQWEVEMYKCPLCPYKSKSRATLQKHQKLQHDENVKIYQCKECSWSTKYRTSILYHELLHKNCEDIPKHKCEKCEYKTKNKTHLTIHMLTHEEGKFKCEECPYRGKRRGDIRRHMLVHSDQSTFSCDQCSYSTHDKEYLLRHKRRINKDPKVVLQCNKCSFRSNSNCSLYMHQHIHNPIEHKFKCDQCEYSAYCRSSLNQHLLTHKQMGETLVYYCATCDFKSKYKTSLRSHIQRCLNKKENDDTDSRVMFRCSQCEYRTICRHSLYSHRKIHDPTKPKLKCEQCEYSTYLRSSLNQHMVTHMKLGETVVYYCATCHFKTKRKHSLTYHANRCSKKKRRNDSKVDELQKNIPSS